jgi:hypothetical protein|tara:strand:+ start:1504 stop:2247 length:744 start_codon:yes stop_codon:yes gene_type:complete
MENKMADTLDLKQIEREEGIRDAVNQIRYDHKTKEELHEYFGNRDYLITLNHGAIVDDIPISMLNFSPGCNDLLIHGMKFRADQEIFHGTINLGEIKSHGKPYRNGNCVAVGGTEHGVGLTVYNYGEKGSPIDIIKSYGAVEGTFNDKVPDNAIWKPSFRISLQDSDKRYIREITGEDLLALYEANTEKAKEWYQDMLKFKKERVPFTNDPREEKLERTQNLYLDDRLHIDCPFRIKFIKQRNARRR